LSLVRPRRSHQRRDGVEKDKRKNITHVILIMHAFVSSCYTPFPACGGIPLEAGQVNVPTSSAPLWSASRTTFDLATEGAELKKEERNKDQTVIHSNR